MTDLPGRTYSRQNDLPDDVPQSSLCALDESGCAHAPQRCVARMGLHPRDRVFLGLYRGLICLWREPCADLQGDADYLGQFGLNVEYDGTVSIAAAYLKNADFGAAAELVFTSWGDELSVSEGEAR